MAGFVIQLDEAELTLRFVEHLLDVKRPPHLTPIEVLDTIKDGGDEEIQAMVLDMHHCAKIAMVYFHTTVAEGLAEGGSMSMGRIEPSERTKQ